MTDKGCWKLLESRSLGLTPGKEGEADFGSFILALPVGHLGETMLYLRQERARAGILPGPEEAKLPSAQLSRYFGGHRLVVSIFPTKFLPFYLLSSSQTYSSISAMPYSSTVSLSCLAHYSGWSLAELSPSLNNKSDSSTLLLEILKAFLGIQIETHHGSGLRCLTNLY